MSVRCARRRDLPAVIACKHPRTEGARLLFIPLFRRLPRAPSRRVNTSAQQTTETSGDERGNGMLVLSSECRRRRRRRGERQESLPFHTDVHGCIRRFPLGVIKIPATDVSLPPSPRCRRSCRFASRRARRSRFALSIPAIVPRVGLLFRSN